MPPGRRTSSRPARQPVVPRAGATTVYTDGACAGNPGPGGWAWAVPGGRWATGCEDPSTNQRMELAAVLDALRSLEGPLHVVSDSTYVVNCFRDGWWEGWLRRGWTNSAKQPVANRDLWEPLVDLYRERGGVRGEVTFDWVKGHSGDAMNDLVDRLAVAAAARQVAERGDEPPDPDALGPPDDLVGRSPASGGTAPDGVTGRRPTPGGAPPDPRVPEGHRVAIFGHGPPELGGYDPNPVSDAVRRRMAEVLKAKAGLDSGVVVLTGLRLGAELLGAEAAAEAGVPYVAVLPYPSPESVWPPATQQRFRILLDGARSVVTLERKAPGSTDDARQALTRRDAWLVRHADEAILVRRSSDTTLARLARSLEDHLGDDVWFIDPDELT